MAWLLTPYAQKQIEEIRHYTVEAHNGEQAEKYLRQLQQSFEHIAAYPKAGKPRDEVKVGYRSIASGKHLIFYRIVGADVEILGVPHGNKDPNNYLD